MEDHNVLLVRQNDLQSINYAYLGEDIECCILGNLDEIRSIDVKTHKNSISVYNGNVLDSNFRLYVDTIGVHLFIVTLKTGKIICQKFYVTSPMLLKIKIIDDYFHNNEIIEAVIENISNTDIYIIAGLDSKSIPKIDSNSDMIEPNFNIHKTYLKPKRCENKYVSLNIQYLLKNGSKGSLNTGAITNNHRIHNDIQFFINDYKRTHTTEMELTLSIKNFLKESIHECEFQLIDVDTPQTNFHYIHEITSEDSYLIHFRIFSFTLSKNLQIKSRFSWKTMAGDLYVMNLISNNYSCLPRPD